MAMSSKTCRGLLLAAVGALTAVGALVAGDAPAAVSGDFKGNGREAKLAYVSAYKRDSGKKERIVITFTEKDHSKEKKPDFKAGFGHFGSALMITVTTEGKIVNCEVAHSAHKKGGFTAIGDIKMSSFKLADGKIEGTLSTGGEVEAFGEKWEVSLKFRTKAP